MSVPVEAADMPAVHALDTEVFGADRSRLVDGLPFFCETLRVVRDGGGIAGYGGVWRNDDRFVVGPLIAQDAETALALVDEIVPEGPIRLDIDHRHPEIIAWAEEHGLRPAFTTTIMEWGAPIANDPARLFLPVAQALG